MSLSPETRWVVRPGRRCCPSLSVGKESDGNCGRPWAPGLANGAAPAYTTPLVSGQALRVCVIVTCHNEGPLLEAAVRSIRESEPIELVIVDDASEDEATRSTLRELESEGVPVLRQEVNEGVAAARMRGLASTSAPFVYPLDADDLAVPGVLAPMADALEKDPWAAACVGDVVEFGDYELLRRTPRRLDPYRVAFTNEYPITALFRRTAIEAAGGWCRLGDHHGYDDWNLWMGLAERGERIIHLHAPAYCRRLHGPRLNQQAKANHRYLYGNMRDRHPKLFAEIRTHRSRSDLPLVKKYLYPHVYGSRPSVPFERTLKPRLDRLGLWTRARPLPRSTREAVLGR
jgi:glycosyltransferase involved in cell wall biosynthesis